MKHEGGWLACLSVTPTLLVLFLLGLSLSPTSVPL